MTILGVGGEEARAIATEIVDRWSRGEGPLHEAITAAILSAESRARPQWQPIETAPRDGTLVLVYKPDQRATGASTFVGYWDGQGWMPVAGAYRVDATEWASCPRPPALVSLSQANTKRGASHE